MAAFVAYWEPRTDITVFDGFWIGTRQLVVRRFEASLGSAKVSDVLPQGIFFGIHPAAKHYMHPIGLDLLNLREEVRVEAELDQCPCLRRSRKFCFERFIRP